jgi:hypothetical protein
MHSRWLLALGVLVVGAALSPATDGPKAPPLKQDLERLQGEWAPAKEAGGARFDGDLAFAQNKLVVTYRATSVGGKSGVDLRTHTVKFALQEEGKNRFISPLKKEDKKLRLRYRFDGDVLVIEEGKWNFPPEVSLRGRWRRIKGERLP